MWIGFCYKIFKRSTWFIEKYIRKIIHTFYVLVYLFILHSVYLISYPHTDRILPKLLTEFCRTCSPNSAEVVHATYSTRLIRVVLWVHMYGRFRTIALENIWCFVSNIHLWVPHVKIPYILESNLHPFYSFRGLKYQVRIRIAVVSWILEKIIELL